MNNDLLYQLALTQVPHIGPVQARILTDRLGSAEAIFRAGTAGLEKIEGIGSVRAKAIRHFKDFDTAEKELAFIEKYRIHTFFLTDPGYPRRLLHCYDPPTLLFFRGEADLNHSRIIAVIGTRSHTPYGKQVTEELITGLRPLNIMVISGLALGIDAVAHKQALQNNLPTIGVLGHGLASIYPSRHASLAREMISQGGGLLTEFTSGTPPDKHNFPIRNRLVAGMTDAVVVIETGVKGGSMITAELANSYHRDVFAFPGKITDPKSAGCNHLIRHHKALLLDNVNELAVLMGWETPTPLEKSPQKELFPELSEEEQSITRLLQEKEAVHIDELNLRSGLSSSATAAAILNLELKNVVQSLPGKLYRLM